VERSGWKHKDEIGEFTDGAAIKIDKKFLSSGIFWGNPDVLLKTKGMSKPRLNRLYCWSGINGGTNCGKSTIKRWVHYDNRWSLGIEVDGPAVEGDSGGPVWDPVTEKIVGSISEIHSLPHRPCVDIKEGDSWCPRMVFTPMLPFRGETRPRAIIKALGVQLVDGG